MKQAFYVLFFTIFILPIMAMEQTNQQGLSFKALYKEMDAYNFLKNNRRNQFCSIMHCADWTCDIPWHLIDTKTSTYTAYEKYKKEYDTYKKNITLDATGQNQSLILEPLSQKISLKLPLVASIIRNNINLQMGKNCYDYPKEDKIRSLLACHLALFDQKKISLINDVDAFFVPELKKIIKQHMLWYLQKQAAMIYEELYSNEDVKDLLIHEENMYWVSGGDSLIHETLPETDRTILRFPADLIAKSATTIFGAKKESAIIKEGVLFGKKFVTLDAPIRTLYAHNNLLAAATVKALHIFNGGKWITCKSKKNLIKVTTMVNTVLVVATQYKLYVLDPSNGKIITTIEPLNYLINALSASKKRIVIGCTDGTVRLFDTTGKNQEILTPNLLSPITAVAADDFKIVAATKNGKIILWDQEFRNCLQIFQACQNNQEIKKIELSKSGLIALLLTNGALKRFKPARIACYAISPQELEQLSLAELALLPPLI